MKKGTHMTEESKKRLSESVAAAYKKRGNYGHYGVHQNDDEVSYRTYQREYKREWYKKNKEKWHNYTMERKYNDMTTEALLKLREKHIKGPVASDEKRQRLINIIEKILIARGALTVECDFEHNYTTKTTAEIFKDWDMCYAPNVAPPKPTRIEIDGVWYDLVEHKGVVVSG